MTTNVTEIDKDKLQHKLENAADAYLESLVKIEDKLTIVNKSDIRERLQHRYDNLRQSKQRYEHMALAIKHSHPKMKFGIVCDEHGEADLSKIYLYDNNKQAWQRYRYNINEVLRRENKSKNKVAKRIHDKNFNPHKANSKNVQTKAQSL